MLERNKYSLKFWTKNLWIQKQERELLLIFYFIAKQQWYYSSLLSTHILPYFYSLAIDVYNPLLYRNIQRLEKRSLGHILFWEAMKKHLVLKGNNNVSQEKFVTHIHPASSHDYLSKKRDKKMEVTECITIYKYYQVW